MTRPGRLPPPPPQTQRAGEELPPRTESGLGGQNIKTKRTIDYYQFIKFNGIYLLGIGLAWDP